MELDRDLSGAGAPRKACIKRFNIVQSALTYATVVGIMMFILLIPFMLIGSAFGGLFQEMPGFGMGGGIVMLLLAPVIYFGLTFVISAIGFAIYNVAAKWTGGIEVEVEA